MSGGRESWSYYVTWRDIVTFALLQWPLHADYCGTLYRQPQQNPFPIFVRISFYSFHCSDREIRFGWWLGLSTQDYLSRWDKLFIGLVWHVIITHTQIKTQNGIQWMGSNEKKIKKILLKILGIISFKNNAFLRTLLKHLSFVSNEQTIKEILFLESLCDWKRHIDIRKSIPLTLWFWLWCGDDSWGMVNVESVAV